MNVLEFQKMKNENQKIAMITCHDTWSAKLLNESDVDCILVGDSGSMIMHGLDSTVGADIPMLAAMTIAVRRGAPDKFIIADMSFLSFRKGLKDTMDNVEALMRAGANAIKIEGVTGHEEVIAHIVGSGIPVMGHLGLTPQSIHGLGGNKVQGRSDEAANLIIDQAHTLEALGCFSIVLECVPSELAAKITNKLHIPTIGIGAGSATSGQVLVMQDMLGMNDGFKPKFLKTYLNGAELLTKAFNQYTKEVKEVSFPGLEESYK